MLRCIYAKALWRFRSKYKLAYCFRFMFNLTSAIAVCLIYFPEF